MFELFAEFVNTKRIKWFSDQEVDDNHSKHWSYSKVLASETTYMEPPHCMFACVKEGKDLGTSRHLNHTLSSQNDIQMTRTACY